MNNESDVKLSFITPEVNQFIKVINASKDDKDRNLLIEAIEQLLIDHQISPKAVIVESTKTSLLDYAISQGWKTKKLHALADELEQLEQLEQKAHFIRQDIIQFIESRNNETSYLIKLLIDQKINPKDFIVCDPGVTLLHYAAAEGWPNFLKYFLTGNSADAHLKDGNNKSVFRYALDAEKFSAVFSILRVVVDSSGSENATNTSKKDNNAVAKNAESLEDFLARENLKPEEVINYKNEYTLLHVAAAYGWKNFLERYFSKKENLEKLELRIGNGNSILEYAAGKGMSSTVIVLIKLGARYKAAWTTKVSSIFIKSAPNPSVLHVAATHNQLEILKFFIKEKKLNADELDSSGFTPLYYGVKEGYFAIVQYLLDNGANPNDYGSSLLTSILSQAVRSENQNEIENILTVLSKKGAYFFPNTVEFTIKDLRIAITKKHLFSLEFILNYFRVLNEKPCTNKSHETLIKGNTSSWDISLFNNSDALEDIVNSFDYSIDEGKKPLLFYALDIPKKATEKKPSKDSQKMEENDSENDQPSEDQIIATVNLLIGAGANPVLRHKDNPLSLLEYAFSIKSHPKVINHLLTLDRIPEKKLALLFATKYNYTEEEKKIVFEEIDFLYLTTEGTTQMTALHYAAKYGNTRLVEEFLKNGYAFEHFVNSVDNSGMSPLAYAANGPDDNMMELMLENGKEPQITENVNFFAQRKDSKLSLKMKSKLQTMHEAFMQEYWKKKTDDASIQIAKKTGSSISELFSSLQQSSSETTSDNKKPMERTQSFSDPTLGSL